MSLQENVAAVLETVRTQEATAQSRRIDEVSKLVDDLVKMGVVEAPHYRLAPTMTVPHGIAHANKSNSARS